MQIFSPIIKQNLKECILSIFWPKKDIYNFFKDCSIPQQTLKHIKNYDEKEFYRYKMVDIVFEKLSSQSDNGTLHFDLMLDVLSEWNSFNKFWFGTEKKLDLEEAKQNIQKLKQAKIKDIDKAKKKTKKLEEKNKNLEEKHKSFDEMRENFHLISLSSETSQKRGIAFEKFLAKMARFYGLKVTNAFKLKGTQIDGTIKYEGENYSIEAKWHDRQMSDEPLLAFCGKQEMNMHGRGVFISINGVTEGALSVLTRSKVKNTIIIDGEDIALILNELIDFPSMLDKKIHAAQTKGSFYINAITGDSKIKL